MLALQISGSSMVGVVSTMHFSSVRWRFLGGPSVVIGR